MNEVIENIIQLEILKQIENLDIVPPSPSEFCNINETIARTILFGGKRLRPLLTFSFAHLINLDLDAVKTVAAAIEQVHAASLAHDDVIDNGNTRRGRATLNYLEGNKKAILAGDFLLAEVINALAQEGNLKLVEEMAKVIASLAKGEWLQVDLINKKTFTEELILEVAKNKTSSVMGWCLLAPAVIKKCNKQEIETVRKIGNLIGLIFQLRDDVLDFSIHSGKEMMADMNNDMLNMVTFKALELAPSRLAAFQEGTPLKELISQDRIERGIISVNQMIDGLSTQLLDLLNMLAEELQIEPKRFEDFCKLVNMIAYRTK